MAVIAVFGSSRITPSDAEYDQARRLGALLARAGHAVVNGGYGGVMEAVSEGAKSESGEVIGITAPSVFPDRAGANEHLSRELQTKTISERIHRLVDTSDAAIALPGSIGTVTELMVAWNNAFVAPFSWTVPKPVITVGDRFRTFVDHLATEFDADPSFLTCVDDVETAVEALGRLLANPGRQGSPG